MGLSFFSFIPKSFEKVILVYLSKQILRTSVNVEITNKDTFSEIELWKLGLCVSFQECTFFCIVQLLLIFPYCLVSLLRTKTSSYELTKQSMAGFRKNDEVCVQ